MANFAIMVDSRKTSGKREDVDKLLKREFRSVEYMEGFCDGYLFDSYTILTMKALEDRITHKTSILETHWCFIVSVDTGD